MIQEERRLWLIRALCRELHYRDPIPQDAFEQKRLLRGLMNVRPPMLASEEFLQIEGEYLEQATREKGVTARLQVRETDTAQGL